ncbi:MAG: OB-fold domain-containing protein [Actinomycetota bacterium]|nr:OB-fold domain-containing protein [Actinomycetota bacterium]
MTKLKGVPPEDIIFLTPNVWTEPFWAATAEHRLILPRCTACTTYRFPPTPFCHACRTQEVEWIEHDGHGEIYSFTIIRHAVIPQVKDALPFVAAVVELPDTDGCRLVGSIVDCEPEAVAIGLPVSMDWYDVREGTTIPVFRLA